MVQRKYLILIFLILGDSAYASVWLPKIGKIKFHYSHDFLDSKTKKFVNTVENRYIEEVKEFYFIIEKLRPTYNNIKTKKHEIRHHELYKYVLYDKDIHTKPYFVTEQNYRDLKNIPKSHSKSDLEDNTSDIKELYQINIEKIIKFEEANFYKQINHFKFWQYHRGSNFSLEYGFKDNQSVGLELNYKQDKFLAKNELHYNFGIFSKFKIGQFKNQKLTFKAALIREQHPKHSPEYYTEWSLLTGRSGTIKKLDIFIDSHVSYAACISSHCRNQGWYSIGTTEGIKLPYGLMITNYNMYQTWLFEDNIIYYTLKNNNFKLHKIKKFETFYEQISIAKKMKLPNIHKSEINFQIGYFFKQNLRYPRYPITGLVFFNMARDLENFDIDKLFSDAKLSYLFLIQAFSELDFVKILINDSIIDNDHLIDFISQNFQISCFDSNKNTNNLKIQNNNNLEFIRNGYIIYSSNSLNGIAINNLSLLQQFPFNEQFSEIFLIKRKSFYNLIVAQLSQPILTKSINFLGTQYPFITAKNIGYKKSIFGFVVINFVMFLKTNLFFHLIHGFGFGFLLLIKIKLFLKSLRIKPNPLCLNYVSEISYLPVYTILVPLYQEIEKLPSLILALLSLNYPKAKLDIKIILEDDDYKMLEAIDKLNFPKFFEIIKVPASFPRTKPKALNYACQFSRGEYLVIYDAEDQPETDQLLKAVINFEQLPKDYACLQAKLNFYNPRENILTRFFSIEYILWFDYILKALVKYDLPIPLGGTSNHFRVNILKQIGFWDPHNVTEDADLGYRLAYGGYKVGILDSYTFEESPNNIGIWLGQRSRWIKGFIQTFLVFINYQILCKSTINFKQKISILFTIGISIYWFFCMPFLFFIVMNSSYSVIKYYWYFNSFIALLFVWGSAYYINYFSEHKISDRCNILDYLAIIILPFYYTLHSFACYMAIYSILKSPFKWIKTHHGNSK